MADSSKKIHPAKRRQAVWLRFLFILLACISVLYSVYLVWQYAQRFFAIDRCLDADGGISLPARQYCEFSEKPAYMLPDLSVHQNSEVVLLSVLLSVCLLIICGLLRRHCHGKHNPY